jgi:hypothetical protein
VLRQVFPGPYYPSNLREADKKSFDDYIHRIPSLEATIIASLKTSASPGSKDTAQDGQKQPHNKDTSSSPTFLSMSQNIYDAVTSRRESINTRCAAVLGTAGILGTLVVAAGQLGLTLRSGPANNYTWAVLVFFLVSLVYLGYAIALALHVHGDIQGEVIDWNNLDTCNPRETLDAYNFNVSLVLLTYANLNWALNNNFKHRLHSAGRSLRNGVIAVIVAGVLSPWAITSTTSGATGTTGALPQATFVVSS